MTLLDGKGDPLRIEQEIKIWLYYEIVYTQTRICPKEWYTKNSLGFWDTNRSFNFSQKINNENLPYSGLCYSSRLHSENQRKQKKKKDKYLDLARELRKLWNTWVTMIPILVDWNGPQRHGKLVGRRGNYRTNWNHSNNSIVEISQNVEKNPGDMREFTVTQIPVKDHQLMLVLKTHKEYNDKYHLILFKIRSYKHFLSPV